MVTMTTGQHNAAGTLAQILARRALACDARPLPPAVVDKVALCVLDFFAGALDAVPLSASRAVHAMAEQGSSGTATLIGSRATTGMTEAAFANAAVAHGLVQEDMHPPSLSHIGVCVIPAVLAAAENAHARGADVVAAIVAGYQLMGRLGRIVVTPDSASRLRPLGMTGAPAAAAAVSRVLGLTEAATTSAIAIGANATGGFNEWARAGTDEIGMHAGFAARNGVVAALLARAGALGAPSAIEGPSGYLAALRADATAADRLSVPDSDYEILDVYHKPAPACNNAQTPSQAALRIVGRERVDPARVSSILVRSFPVGIVYPGCDYTGPFRTTVQAKMSIQFGVAATLASGRIDADNYTRLDDPVVERLARLTRLEADDGFARAFPAQQGAEVRVTLDDGRVLTERMTDLVPLGPEAVRARFRRAATRRLSATGASDIEQEVDALIRLDDVARLMARLRR
jgi:2-methylcitrate dehydratase PrpD